LAILTIAEAIGIGVLLYRQRSPAPVPQVAIPAPAPAASVPGPRRQAPQPTPPTRTNQAPAVTETPSPAVAGTSGRASAPVTPPEPLPPGWLAIDAPVEVRVYADGQLLGSAARGRFPLAAGPHEILLVNESLQFRSTETVDVLTGGTVTVSPTIATLP
jgi:hypothetical protein